MFHSETTRLIAYWGGLNAGRAPTRASFDPIQAGGLLPHMFLLAREGDRLAVRIAGEALCDLTGRRLKGSDIFDLFTSTARPLARRAALQSIRDSVPMVLFANGRADHGAQVPLEILLAPVTDSAGVADRLIGLVQPTATLAHLQGRPVREIVVRMATAGSSPVRPPLRLAAVDGQRLA